MNAARRPVLANAGLDALAPAPWSFAPRHTGPAEAWSIRAAPLALIVIASLILATGVRADLATDRTNLAHANELYRQKKYAEALDAYMALAKRASGTALFFNASDAAFRAGRLGLAVLMCERARRLSPRDPDVLSNLAFLHRHLADKLPSDDPDLVTKVANWVLDMTAADRLAHWVAVLIWLACAGGFAILLLPPGRGRSLWVVVTVLLGAAALSSGALLAFKAFELEAHPRAVILAPEVVALSGPSTDEVKRFSLHEGATVLLVRASEGWMLIALPNGEAAWVPRTALEEI